MKVKHQNYNLDLMMLLMGFNAIFCFCMGTLIPDMQLFLLWMLIFVFFLCSFLMGIHTAIRHPKRLGFLHVLVFMTALSWMAYGLTSLNSDNTVKIEAALISVAQNVIGLLTLVMSTSWLLKRKTRIILNDWVSIHAQKVRDVPLWAIWSLLLVYALLISYRFMMGIMISGTGGIMTEVSTIQSILLQLYKPVSGIVSVCGFFLLYGKDSTKRKLGWMIFTVQVALFFLGGRRELIQFFMLGGLIWVTLKGISIKRISVFGFSLILLLIVAGPLFYKLRLTALKDGIHLVDATTRSAILTASVTRVMDDFSLNEALSPEYVENFHHRAGFFDWTVTLQERLMQGWSVRGGQIAFESLMEVIPRILLPEKLKLLGDFRIEQKIQLWFDMPLGDRSSTILAYAITDGGWLGVFLYFAAFGVVLCLLLSFMVSANFTFPMLWAVSAVFGVCFNIEMDLPGLIGVLRMLVAIAFIDWALKKVIRQIGRQKRINIRIMSLRRCAL